MQAAESANGAATHPAAAPLLRAAEHVAMALAALGVRTTLWGGRYDLMTARSPEEVVAEEIVGPALDEFLKDHVKPALDAFEARLSAENEALAARIAYLEKLTGAARKVPLPRVGSPRVVASPPRPLAEAQEARLAGYEGEPCPACGKLTLVRSGERWACDSCGARDQPREPP